MNAPDHRSQLSFIEAQLFASTELAVITAIDQSEDAVAAISQLQELGMNAAEAAAVLEMPLRARLQVERRRLFDEAQRLRDLID